MPARIGFLPVAEGRCLPLGSVKQHAARTTQHNHASAFARLHKSRHFARRPKTSARASLDSNQHAAHFTIVLSQARKVDPR
jgi:hypothetical protein